MELEKVIDDVLCQAGIPEHLDGQPLKGYQYLKTAVLLSLEEDLEETG